MEDSWICAGCGHGPIPGHTMICPVCGMVNPQAPKPTDAKSDEDDRSSEG